jgi:hypothetical protein
VGTGWPRRRLAEELIVTDRYGSRPFATAGMVLAAGMYLAIMAFPPNSPTPPSRW